MSLHAFHKYTLTFSGTLACQIELQSPEKALVDEEPEAAMGELTILSLASPYALLTEKTPFES
jgi:hypothetical protein